MFRLVKILLFTAGSGLGAACLLPQDIHLLEDPKVFNQPPHIDIQTAEPLRRACLSNVGEAPQTRLRARVTDPNGAIGQRLEARWFLDYDPESTAPAMLRVQSLSARRLADSFSYDPLEFPTDLLLNRGLVDNSIHEVEVVVSDGFDDDALPRNRAPAERCGEELEGPCYVTSFRWFVTYRENVPCRQEDEE